MQEKSNKMSLKFISVSENEPFARSCIQAFCLPLNPTISELNDVKTAVSEAVTNCIVHAYPDKKGIVTVDAETFCNRIHIKITDEGEGIEDVTKAVEPFFTTRPEEERSGMGFTVMKAFMDDVKVLSKPGEGTVVEMMKLFSSGSEAELGEEWGRDA
ncbi:MAG: anti-sigma F factor [Clostridia bacterium]|nr:anti-sigma F factor [Clostridia bacterium]